MNITTVKPGDIVHCDVRGRVFYARVIGRERTGHLAVDPITPNVNHFVVAARQVTAHWRKAGRPRAGRSS